MDYVHGAWCARVWQLQLLLNLLMSKLKAMFGSWKKLREYARERKYNGKVEGK